MGIKTLEMLRFDKSAEQITPKPIQAVMTSWRSVYPAIKELKDSEASLKKLSSMLAYEISRGAEARGQILARIHMRINAMRYRMELNEIFKVAGVDMPPPPKVVSRSRTSH